MSEHGPSYGDDDDDFDDGSAYSLASTANDMLYEHGRRFPNYRSHSSLFPRGDKLARDNEQALHNLNLCLYDDKLFIAPLRQPQNVLDVHCGQLGLWAKDMSDRYPDAHVTGIDQLIPETQGQPNLSFILQSFTDDPWILDEITQLYGKFDLIYIRSLFATRCDFSAFYKRCLEHLAPGGYIEQCEIGPYCQCDDGTGREDSVMAQMCRMVPDFEKHTSTHFDLASNMAMLIHEAGFEDIQRNVTKAPWSPWPPAGTKEHEIGRHFQHFYESGIQGWILQPLIQSAKLDAETVDKLAQAALNELRENDMHWWSPAVTVTARKPLNAPSQDL